MIRSTCFGAPLCPLSGAGGYTVIHSMWHITLVMAARATSLNPDA